MKEIVKPYFKAGGNEPFWNIEIANNQILFTSLIEGFEKVQFDHVDPIRVMDANVKTYRLKNNDVSLNITISQKECSDTMADKVSSYSVRADIKKNTEKEYQLLNGCGNYIADYRLHDIWSLDYLKGKKVTSENFAKQKPYIEINNAENTFMGYAGCNTVNGKIFTENKLLRFTDVITTLKMCLPNNEETAFLQALQSATAYKIEQNSLTLSNPSGDLLVFRKVD
ncbi:META domain-containing protein [Flavobacterium agrisoli]|nr:META domain-containing protein [Flavobacterium agrisoli]